MDSSVHIREWGEDSSTEEETLDSVVHGSSNVREQSSNKVDDAVLVVRCTSRSSLNSVATAGQDKEQPSVPSEGEQVTESKKCQEENVRLRIELDEARSLVMVAQCTLEDSIDSERRKCREEIATLQQLMRENVTEAVRSTQSRFEAEIRRLKSIVVKLENENQELKAQDKEGSNVLTTVTKTLARKATMALSSSPSVDDNLENSMRRAQEDVEVLRSLVLPLEEEIKALKDKLRTADDQLRMHEAMQTDMVKNSEALGAILRGTPLPDVLTQLDEKLNEVSSNLKAEKSSRADLEMYVTILRTQKTVLQEDRDRLKTQMQEVCRHLEQERRAHRELRRTWQQANDQFLESQREHAQELLSLQAILTPEQLHQYSEMKQLSKAKTDSDKTPVSMKDKLSLAKEKLSLSPLFNRISPVLKRKSPTSTPSKMGASRENSPNRVDERVVPLSKSPPNLVNLEMSEENVVEKQAWFNINGQSLHDSVREDTMSLLGETPMSNSNSWTGLMELTQPTNDDLWHLQDESFDNKTTVSQPCSMCANYEAQLQRAQEDATKMDKLSKAMQKDLDKARQDLAGMTQLVKDMEAKWTEVAQDYEKQVTSLFSQTETLQRNLTEAKQLYRDYRQQAQESLKELTYDRERVNKELVRLQQENEDLVGKHSVRAEELQNEIINLPNNLQDMQFLLLKWREDLIAAKVAKEAIENQLKSQLLFLKDQVLAEQQAKEQLEDSLTGENDHLRQELGILRSVQTQLEDECSKKQKLEKKLHECLAKLNELERSYREVCEGKAKAEQEVLQMRSKVASLQADMETSETVQRDFVKLSQSLQVQLERIRQSEKELRWQHEDDVEDCSECKQPFSVTKRKHHCRHCGHIFCADCLRKTVYSGPQRRPNKVCNVCHYLLVQDSAPFFSTEPPHTPV